MENKIKKNEMNDGKDFVLKGRDIDGRGVNLPKSKPKKSESSKIQESIQATATSATRKVKEKQATRTIKYRPISKISSTKGSKSAKNLQKKRRRFANIDEAVSCIQRAFRTHMKNKAKPRNQMIEILKERKKNLMKEVRGLNRREMIENFEKRKKNRDESGREDGNESLKGKMKESERCDEKCNDNNNNSNMDNSYLDNKNNSNSNNSNKSNNDSNSNNAYKIDINNINKSNFDDNINKHIQTTTNIKDEIIESKWKDFIEETTKNNNVDNSRQRSNTTSNENNAQPQINDNNTYNTNEVENSQKNDNADIQDKYFDPNEPVNSDLKNLTNYYAIDDIDEEIIKNYRVEEKEIKEENLGSKHRRKGKNSVIPIDVRENKKINIDCRDKEKVSRCNGDNEIVEDISVEESMNVIDDNNVNNIKGGFNFDCNNVSDDNRIADNNDNKDKDKDNNNDNEINRVKINNNLDENINTNIVTNTSNNNNNININKITDITPELNNKTATYNVNSIKNNPITPTILSSKESNIQVKEPLPNIEPNSTNPTQIIAYPSNLHLELSECKKTIKSLQKIIAGLHSQLQSKDSMHSKNLLLHQQENSLLLNKQSTILDSLYAEKRQLETQVSDLREKLENLEKNNYKKMQKMRENYELEMQKNKEAWIQTEKLRRKKWEEARIKEIKALTAKGLEPEIERIIREHKVEINEIKEKYGRMIEKEREEIVCKYENEIVVLKKNLNKEKDEIAEIERQNLIQKLNSQKKRIEEEFLEENKRLQNKLKLEVERLENLREKDKEMYENQIQKLESQNENQIKNTEKYYQQMISKMQRDFDSRINSEIESQKSELLKKNDEILSAKESELEAKYKDLKSEILKDKEKQLNSVIEKLSEETALEKQKLEKKAEKKANEKNLLLIEENFQLQKKLSEVSDKLKAETKNRVNLESNIEKIHKKLKNKQAEFDAQERSLKSLQRNYDDLSEKMNGLVRDFNKEKLSFELEMKAQLQKGDAEINLIQTRLENERKKFGEEKAMIENKHRREIGELEEKIKKSFMRKDEIIKTLQNELNMKNIAVSKYEEMMNKQRMELLKKD